MSNIGAKFFPIKITKKSNQPNAILAIKPPLKIRLKTSTSREIGNQSILVLSSHYIKKDVLLESFEQIDQSLHSHLILLPSISHKLDYKSDHNLSLSKPFCNNLPVFNYNSPLSLEAKLDNNWQILVNWITTQARSDGQFFKKLGCFLTRSRLGIFRSYHIKKEFNLGEQLKNINNLWSLYNQSYQGMGNKLGLAQKLQKLYQEGYLSTLQKLSILKFFSDFQGYIVGQYQKSNTKNSTNPDSGSVAPKISLHPRLGFKPKIKLRSKTELNPTVKDIKENSKYASQIFDKRWNKFIDNWFKCPINTHTQFEASAYYFLEQIYKQLMTENKGIESNIPRLKTIEICLSFLKTNKNLINSSFEFPAHLNDLYYNLPHKNYIFRQELLNLWQALFLAYQGKVSTSVSSSSEKAESKVERASIQVW